jgi:prepilin-type N-terminal cleavage/methylation domain-containing protein
MRGEAGYTLIELLVVVAMIAILTAVSTEYLAQQPAQLSSAIQQFTLKLEETRALALANAGRLNVGDGTAVVAGTGATLWISPDPTDSAYTTATLYWYRPIPRNPLGGEVEADTSSPPLRVRASILANIPGDGQSSRFAIFVSPSGHSSAATDKTWPLNGRALLKEPFCDSANPPQINFADARTSREMTLTCDGARLSMKP